jgi:4-hydroxy-2-oxoheptanedioate aldolase
VFDAVRAAGTPVGVNAFDPQVADAYLAAGADFIAVGADVTLLARGSSALAERFLPPAKSPETP